MKKQIYLRIIIVIISLYILVSISPIIWILITSLKTVAEIGSNPFGLPIKPTLYNYKLVFSQTEEIVASYTAVSPLLLPLMRTFLVSAVCVLLSIFLGLMGAYGLSRYNIGGNFLPFWFLSLLFAPPIVFAFPLYLMFRKIGLLDTMHGLVAANLIFNLPFSIWIFYSTLNVTPEDIEEAAVIEGATSWLIFRKVIIPLMSPVITSVGALVFIFVWGEYLFSTILMMTQNPLTIALAEYSAGQLVLYTVIAAGIIVDIIPPIIILIFFEKYLVTGLSFGTIQA